MNKVIMIIGAGILQVPAIKIAREMGLLTLVTDYNPTAYGMKFADFPVVMSTRDVDGTVRIAKQFVKQRRIDGVITVGTDASLTVAAVQHALDLPGNRIDVAEATTHKIKMRQRLEDNGIPQPVFFACWTYDDVVSSGKKIGFPFVIKPVDNMGARGVMRVNKPEVIRFAYERAKNASPRGEIITEGFMDGPELSIDALVWDGEIYVRGVADRIIEFPPYFVETGHIMPTELPEAQVKEALSVFKNGVHALGIETGAAKGDIKITSDGAKVGEIASRLSGGFMSAYTYPYSSGVNLIKAALNIAMGELPGDISEKYQRVSVERAIIPGSGIVREIEGVAEALSIKNVKNVFVTCDKGDTVHIPTNNVEKCGNVIAVADTREEALRDANLGIKLVRITLGDEGELNEGLLRKEALGKLGGICSVCRTCDGKECAGWIPGIGSKGAGEGFFRNIQILRNFVIVPDLLKRIDNTNTGSNIFGIPLDLPMLPAPISNIRRNLRGLYSEKEYNRILLQGAKRSGTIGCISQMEYEEEVNDIDYLINPIKDAYGHGIPFFDPYCGENTTLKNIEKAFQAGVKVCGLTLDLKDSPGATLIDEYWLSDIIKKAPVPVIIKGVLTTDNVVKAMDAGAKGIVLSNRGGRILSSLPSGIEVVKDVRSSCGNNLLIIVDGGIRNGEDMFKALSQGADLVMIGRPIFIALAAKEEEGVSFYIDKIKRDFITTMLVSGAKTVKDITPQMTQHSILPLY
ncbi:MAG: alpha-hydroxy-acid oxidizing protein [Spirochaetota bacterium]|nr:MAG: alpha-hydroxy-acid oxidizing protein [Spirochaetota bacterium]